MSIDKTADAYEHLIARFVKWAQNEPEIRAALVIGSRARTDHPTDEWADLDIIVVVNELAPYVQDAHWVTKVGTPWLTFIEPTADGRSVERRVLFEGGLDVDFAFIPVALIQQMINTQVPPDVADIFRRGVRVLLDKDKLTELLHTRIEESQPSHLPTEHEFLEAINDFWYHAVWVAKHLRRGELWWAKSGCDSHMKALLCQMMEWHARAIQGCDTWFRGRFLEEWADPRALKELKKSFAHYDEDDIWRALFATMDLFRWVAIETANQLRYSYPTSGDERATELVKKLFSTRVYERR